MRGRFAMHGFGLELRLALRGLRRSPLFAATAVATLAIGVAALASVFSVVDAVLVRPLPYRQPERLVALWETNAPGSGSLGRVDGATFADWREADAGFERLAASLLACLVPAVHATRVDPARVLREG